MDRAAAHLAAAALRRRLVPAHPDADARRYARARAQARARSDYAPYQRPLRRCADPAAAARWAAALGGRVAAAASTVAGSVPAVASASVRRSPRACPAAPTHCARRLAVQRQSRASARAALEAPAAMAAF